VTLSLKNEDSRAARMTQINPKKGRTWRSPGLQSHRFRLIIKEYSGGRRQREPPEETEAAQKMLKPQGLWICSGEKSLHLTLLSQQEEMSGAFQCQSWTVSMDQEGKVVRTRLLSGKSKHSEGTQSPTPPP
jgi:hypothetical protein